LNFNPPIDLRSDTVTRPSKAMLEYMMQAKVGDDVFDEDPTVQELEAKAAAIFGKEAGVFCPSGTMTNQVGIKVLTRPGDEVICDQTAHMYLYEGGGLMFNSGVSVWLLQGDLGRINAAQVEASVRADHVYFPKTSVVIIENTHNRGGGSVYDLEAIAAIRKVCDQHRLKMHLDGARIFNAMVNSNYSPLEIGSYFETISVCLSKGLGAPVGSVLLSSKENIKEARRIRKVMGGGMRQAGYLAAAGIYALDHNVSRLKEDHHHAAVLGDCMKSLAFVESILPVTTNMVVSKLENNYPAEAFINTLKNYNVLAVPFGSQSVRMVTHLDFTGEMLDYTCSILKKI
jgi:threonine aldolase